MHASFHSIYNSMPVNYFNVFTLTAHITLHLSRNNVQSKHTVSIKDPVRLSSAFLMSNMSFVAATTPASDDGITFVNAPFCSSRANIFAATSDVHPSFRPAPPPSREQLELPARLTHSSVPQSMSAKLSLYPEYKELLQSYSNSVEDGPSGRNSWATSPP